MAVPDSAFVFPPVGPASRPMSAQLPPRDVASIAHRRSMNALPHFSFSPGQTSSTGCPPATPTRPPRHRRGLSELIGPQDRPSLPAQSTAAEVPAVVVDSTQPNHLIPPTGRRGNHAHRRSAAISGHDLPSILRGPETARSAPVWQTHHLVPSRSRVGFSDRVEVIRPLSTISSGTDGSLSTIRGHSMSGSLSSVVSHNSSSPASSRTSPSTVADMRRPSTSESPSSRSGRPHVPRQPTGASPRTSARNSALYVDTSIPPVPPIPFSHLTDGVTIAAPSPASALTETDPSTSPELRQRIRQERRRSSPKAASAPILPVPVPCLSAQSLSFLDPPVLSTDVDSVILSLDSFDVDDTVTLVADDTSFESFDSAASSPSPSPHVVDLACPTIDLDAALGPFNTPEQVPRSARQRRFMHSGLVAVNQAHRRTESAPELEAFDTHPTYQPVPTMADVFEEEEDAVDADSDGSETTPTAPAHIARPDRSNVAQVDNPSVPIGFCASEAPELVMSDPAAPLVAADNDGSSRRPSVPITLPFILPVPASPSFSSPTVSTDPSVDTPRIGTAASSVADCRIHTSSGAASEVRLSVDVSSVASGRSMKPDRFGLSPNMPVSAISMSSSGSREDVQFRRQRGSIVSLSRLMSGSSLRERSQLGVDPRPQSALFDPALGAHQKKPSRLFRMMRFLRPRDARLGP